MSAIMSACSAFARSCSVTRSVNAFADFVRCGIVNWIPTCLQTAKGFSCKDSSLAGSLFEYSAIPGTRLCAWSADRMFLDRHALNLVPKKSAGTAAGFTGFFGCVFGSASANTGLGWRADC